MKIGILSKSKAIYSTRRLLEAAEKRGHEAQVVNPIRCYMNIASHKPTVHYKNKLLTDFDAIIPRIGASITFYGTAVVRQFEMMNVFSVNESVAISRSRDKLRCLQLLSKRGLGLPVTGFAHSTQSTEDLIKLVGGAPLVIKILEGTQGKGAVLAETQKAAESVIDAFRGLSAHFLVQEFIEHAGVADIRCLVIGGKVVASMKRETREGEFRTNFGHGGLAVPVRITPEERSTAIRAAGALGLNFAGVDILRTKHGPVVMEVNSTPDLENIEKVTGQDIAKLIIEFIEKNAKKLSTRTRGEG